MKRGIVLLSLTAFFLTGCASGRTKQIAWGMLAGAAVGAVVGNQFVHHGQYRQYESQNTAATAVIFALGTGAVLNWHYESLQQQEVEISGRFSRFRLCNPDELNPDLAQGFGSGERGAVSILQGSQIGRDSISLDGNTKWSFPVFRRRDLPPERSEEGVISERYVWEIVRPGGFVTRSQNPDFFATTAEKPVEHEPEKKKDGGDR